MSDSWEPILRFTSDHPEFTLGFEAGMLCADLQDMSLLHLERTLHAGNEEQARRIARREGFRFHADPLGEGWIIGVFKRHE